MGRSQVQMLLISRGHPLATAQMQYFGQLRAGSTPKLPANRSNVPVLVDMGISPLLLVSPPHPLPAVIMQMCPVAVPGSWAPTEGAPWHRGPLSSCSRIFPCCFWPVRPPGLLVPLLESGSPVCPKPGWGGAQQLAWVRDMGRIPRGLWPPNRGSRVKRDESLQEVGAWDRPGAQEFGFFEGVG